MSLRREAYARVADLGLSNPSEFLLMVVVMMMVAELPTRYCKDVIRCLAGLQSADRMRQMRSVPIPRADKRHDSQVLRSAGLAMRRKSERRRLASRLCWMR